jgi:Gpi18-like mannosyltransferase
MLKKIEDFLDRFGNCIFFIIVLIIGTMAKIAMFPAGNSDLNTMVSWYDYIATHGRFAALKDEFAEYNVSYLYLLTLATFFPVAKYTAIKLISLVFDFLAAFAAYKIVGLKYQNKTLRMVSFLAVFLAPTVLINGAYWGQTDIIYTALILWSLYFAFKKNGNLSAISFGLAFSIKLQAIFALPLIGIFVVKRLMKIRHLIWIPLTCFVLLLPSFIVGRDMESLLSVFINQTGHAGDYQQLSMQCPNFYYLFSSNAYDEISGVGQVIAFSACFVIMFYAFKMRKFLDKTLILKLGVFSVLIVVYFLPNMHERYFFIADILSILLVFYSPRLFYVPIVIGFSSLLSYLQFLRVGDPLVDFRILAAAVTVIIVLLGWELVKDAFLRVEARSTENPGLNPVKQLTQ